MDRLTFYRSGIRREWRWKYQDGGNFRKLANAGESYKALSGAMKNAYRVLGIISDVDTNHPIETSVQKATGENVHVRILGKR